MTRNTEMFISCMAWKACLNMRSICLPSKPSLCDTDGGYTRASEVDSLLADAPSAVMSKTLIGRYLATM